MLASATNIQSTQEAWFDEFIAAIRTHQLQLETHTASDELKKMYEIFMQGKQDDLAFHARISSNQHFIKKVIVDYLHEIKDRVPQKLAFDLDDSEVLVWAEIENDDEEMENFLLLAEANVNASFHQYGYDLTSTIVEVRDHLPIPNHYSVYKD